MTTIIITITHSVKKFRVNRFTLTKHRAIHPICTRQKSKDKHVKT